MEGKGKGKEWSEGRKGGKGRVEDGRVWKSPGGQY